jgi:hypothetical protein
MTSDDTAIPAPPGWRAWIAELSSAVRLYAQGTATGDQVRTMIERIYGMDDELRDADTLGEFAVRGLLAVVGEATVQQDREVYDAGLVLLDECDEQDRTRMAAHGIVRAYAQVWEAGAAIARVRQAHREVFGP